MYYKYKKYKKKYIDIKNQIGGECQISPDDNDYEPIEHEDFIERKYIDALINMGSYKTCYSTVSAARLLKNNTDFPKSCLLDPNRVPVNINQIWYIIVSNNNYLRKITQESGISYFLQHSETENNDKKPPYTFLYTETQKKYIEAWLTFFKTNKLYIMSFNSIHDNFAEIFIDIEEYIDTLQNLPVHPNRIILPAESELVISSEEQYNKFCEKYHNFYYYWYIQLAINKMPYEYKECKENNALKIANFNKHDTDGYYSTIRSTISRDKRYIPKLIVCDENIVDFKSHMSSMQRDTITSPCNYLKFHYFTRAPLETCLHPYNKTWLRDIAYPNNDTNKTRKKEFEEMQTIMVRLINFIDSLNKRIDDINKLLTETSDKYPKTYLDSEIFSFDTTDPSLIQNNNRTNFKTYMKKFCDEYDEYEENSVQDCTRHNFILGLFHEITYFRVGADEKNIPYTKYTIQLHLYKIAKEVNCLNILARFIYNISYYQLENLQNMLCADVNDELFRILVFGYFSKQPEEVSMESDTNIVRTVANTTNLQNMLDSINNESSLRTLISRLFSPQPNVMEVNIGYPNGIRKIINAINNSNLNDTKKKGLIKIIKCIYCVLTEIENIISSYGEHDMNYIFVDTDEVKNIRHDLTDKEANDSELLLRNNNNNKSSKKITAINILKRKLIQQVKTTTTDTSKQLAICKLLDDIEIILTNNANNTYRSSTLYNYLTKEYNTICEKITIDGLLKQGECEPCMEVNTLTDDEKLSKTAECTTFIEKEDFAHDEKLSKTAERTTFIEKEDLTINTSKLNTLRNYIEKLRDTFTSMNLPNLDKKNKLKQIIYNINVELINNDSIYSEEKYKNLIELYKSICESIKDVLIDKNVKNICKQINDNIKSNIDKDFTESETVPDKKLLEKVEKTDTEILPDTKLLPNSEKVDNNTRELTKLTNIINTVKKRLLGINIVNTEKKKLMSSLITDIDRKLKLTCNNSDKYETLLTFYNSICEKIKDILNGENADILCAILNETRVRGSITSF